MKQANTNLWVLVSIFLAIVALSMYFIIADFTSSASESLISRIFG
jgi:hypothetical protein